MNAAGGVGERANPALESQGVTVWLLPEHTGFPATTRQHSFRVGARTVGTVTRTGVIVARAPDPAQAI